MTQIDHVTYQVPVEALTATKEDEALGEINPISEFMDDLGLTETQPAAEIEKDWRVRWWTDENEMFTIHLVEHDDAVTLPLGLSHFCITEVGQERYENLRDSEWLEADTGSGRIWLKGPAGLRVEVHA